jgi:hypothetical protein
MLSLFPSAFANSLERVEQAVYRAPRSRRLCGSWGEDLAIFATVVASYPWRPKSSVAAVISAARVRCRLRSRRVSRCVDLAGGNGCESVTTPDNTALAVYSHSLHSRSQC